MGTMIKYGRNTAEFPQDLKPCNRTEALAAAAVVSQRHKHVCVISPSDVRLLCDPVATVVTRWYAILVVWHTVLNWPSAVEGRNCRFGRCRWDSIEELQAQSWVMLLDGF